MFSRCLPLASCMLLTIVSGCGATSKWTYPPNESVRYSAKHAFQDRVAVVMGSDQRAADNSNYFPLYLIPLAPWGWAEYERPEAARQYISIVDFEMDMSKDPALAVADEFKRSGLFPNAFFTYGGDTRDALICKVTPEQFQYHGRLISYGLSVFGPLLWFIGLPAGWNECNLAFDVSLQDSSGKTLWSGKLAGAGDVVIGLYYHLGKDATPFATVFESKMQELLPQIEAAMSGRVMASP